MCNPPFFANPSEKAVNPRTVCTATESEMSTEGGEFAFVSHIIQDSLVLRERIRWYTSMIGRKVNVKKLLNELHKHHVRERCPLFLFSHYLLLSFFFDLFHAHTLHFIFSVKITNIRQVEFVQGKTTRWAIGWSFSQEGLELIQVMRLPLFVSLLSLHIKCVDER
jgi:23S rRNA (adenine1618-N6)-methyltransferase